MASRYGLHIRAAIAADADGLAELMRASGHVVTSTVMAERLAAVRSHGFGSVLLAMEWGPPSGVLAFHWHSTIGADMPLAQIDWLAVLPGERRRGIARTLLKSASQAARMAGCGSFLLSVPLQADGSLQAFCGASGFEPSGVSFTRSLRKTRSDR